MLWIYMLSFADGSYYTGHPDDLEKKLAQQSEGLGLVAVLSTLQRYCLMCDIVANNKRPANSKNGKENRWNAER